MNLNLSPFKNWSRVILIVIIKTKHNAISACHSRIKTFYLVFLGKCTKTWSLFSYFKQYNQAHRSKYIDCWTHCSNFQNFLKNNLYTAAATQNNSRCFSLRATNYMNQMMS